MTDIAHAAYVNTHGQIVNLMTLGAWVPEEGQDPLNSDLTIVHIADEISDVTDFIQSNYYKDGNWHDRTKKSGGYYIWENEDWVLDSALLWEVIREERRNRLQVSDWTQVADSQLSDSKKTEWTTYRQSLRDVPVDNSNVTDLDQVSWPTEPS
tara:strand:+ start:101 stop:559 length:459 start_codon:yes stop_codon:yes gene_type:complete